MSGQFRREDIVMRGLFEGWHLIILLLVVVVLFGGKRLPDVARGLGSSLRIFKREMKEMQEEDHRTAQAKSPEPIEGRVIDGDGRASAPTEQRRDA